MTGQRRRHSPATREDRILEHVFSRLAQWTGGQLGRPHTFAMACLAVLVWAATGPFFNYSDTWQLVINTSTTIITFLMVFLLQHTQNRDTRVIQLKLDELIRANVNARDALLGLENLTDEDMQRIQAHFAALAKIGAIPEELVGAQENLQKARSFFRRVQSRLGGGKEAVQPERVTPTRHDTDRPA